MKPKNISGAWCRFREATVQFGSTPDGPEKRRRNAHVMTTQAVPGWSALPANLCPLSVCPKLARFAEGFSKAVGEAVEATARSAVWQRTTEHLQHMLSREQRIDHPAESSSQGGEGCLRQRSKMPRFGASRYSRAPICGPSRVLHRAQEPYKRTGHRALPPCLQ